MRIENGETETQDVQTLKPEKNGNHENGNSKSDDADPPVDEAEEVDDASGEEKVEETEPKNEIGTNGIENTLDLDSNGSLSSQSESDDLNNDSSSDNDESEYEEVVRPERKKVSTLAIVDKDATSANDDKDGAEQSTEKPPPTEPKKRGRKRKTVVKDVNWSDSDNEVEQTKKRKKRRTKKEKVVEFDENGQPIKKKRGRKPKPKVEKEKKEEPETRHKLRKIIESEQLDERTIKAEQDEKERRERLERIEKEEKEKSEKDNIKDQLVLQHEPRVFVDSRIAKRLKPHQNEGIKFMYANLVETVEHSKNQAGQGCILAHCMGLGKTIQTLAFLQAVIGARELDWCKKILVLCPMNTLHNWLRELHEWLDELEREELKFFSLVDAPTPKERVQELKNWTEQGGIMVMGYDMYRILATGTRTRVGKYKKLQKIALVDPGPDIIVCDEGHLLKNSESAIAKVLATIKTRRRCVLTGTPLQNNLIEYHCMASFVKPDLLGTLKEFRNRFVNPILNGQHADSTGYDVTIMKRRAHVLHNLLSGCVQRKDYQVLAKHLPEKHEYIVSVRLTKFQRDLYKFYLDNVSNKGEKEVNAKGRAVSGLFGDYQNLMRVWTHPKLLETHSLKREFSDLLIEREEAESDIEEMENQINSEDEEIAVLEDDDPGLNSTDDDHSDKFNFGEDAPLIMESVIEEEPRLEKMTRAERRRKRNEDKTKIRDGDDVGEFQTLESAERQKYEWWGSLSKDVDLNGLHHSSKIQVLLELLRVCELRGEKLLVFSQSLLSLDLIEEFLAQCTALVDGNLPSPAGTGRWKKNSDYFRMDGATSGGKRHEFINYFNDVSDTRARLFMISTKAGCLGVNLVAATRVVIFDASWNPTHDIQSIFRVYRIGQTKPVFIYRLVAQGTMEEKVYRRQVQKQGLAQRVLDEQQVGRFFSQGDLKELYMFECEGTPEHEDDGGKRFKKPKDTIFADILYQGNWSRRISKYHEHDSLLDHIESEELSPEERAAAWAEYEAERTHGYTTHVHQQQQQQQQFLKQQRDQQRQQQLLLKQQQEKQRKLQHVSNHARPPSHSSGHFSSGSATTSSFGGANDAQAAIQQLVVLNQALQQRALELEEAKNEAEQAGAGDTSLDSMSTDDLVEKMAAAPLYAALGREELRKIAAAALAETQKQRDKARKKLEVAITNFTLVQQSLQLQTMVVMQQNPQLAPLILSQIGVNQLDDSKSVPGNVMEQLLSQHLRK